MNTKPLTETQQDRLDDLEGRQMILANAGLKMRPTLLAEMDKLSQQQWENDKERGLI